MRLLYNDKFSADKINDVRDHVEYYVDNNDEGNKLILKFGPKIPKKSSDYKKKQIFR